MSDEASKKLIEAVLEELRKRGVRVETDQAYLTAEEIAEYFNISKKTVNRFVKEHHVIWIEMGGKRKFSFQDIIDKSKHSE